MELYGPAIGDLFALRREIRGRRNGAFTSFLTDFDFRLGGPLSR